jgi:hypothetical protein
MSRPFADRYADDFREGESDFKRYGRADYSRDQYSQRDEDYFGGFERAQEEQERHDRARREEEQAHEDAEERRAQQRREDDRQQEEQQQEENHPNFGDVG